MLLRLLSQFPHHDTRMCIKLNTTTPFSGNLAVDCEIAMTFSQLGAKMPV